MITKAQAVMLKYREELHYAPGGKGCSVQTITRGPSKGARYVKCTKVRVNGACKTWSTRPDEFRVPWAYGLYGHGYVDQDNADDFHRVEDCICWKQIDLMDEDPAPGIGR